MKKNSVILFLFIAVCCSCLAQNDWKKGIDSEWATVSNDTNRVMILSEYANYYKFKKPDSGLFYAYKGLALSRKIGFVTGEVDNMLMIALCLTTAGNHAKALQINLQSLKITEEYKLTFQRALAEANLGKIYSMSRNYVKALSSFKESTRLFDLLHDSAFYVGQLNNVSDTYLLMNQLDSALYTSKLAYDNVILLKNGKDWAKISILESLGKIYLKLGNTDLALDYFRQSLMMADEPVDFIVSDFFIAQLYKQTGQPDSAIYYAKKSLEVAQENGFYPDAIEASVLLSAMYEGRDPQKALTYSKEAIALKDSFSNQGMSIALENVTSFDEQERQYEIDKANTLYQSRVKQYILLGGLAVFLIIAFILYRNNRQKQKANKVLGATLDDLKSTQSQLIQSEKMASLGELTAGIAHEIQNPLNFVNNFSEVNKELLEELKSKNEKLKIHDAEIDELVNDISENSEKINHHGKRADAIVKGMLQHSQSGKGQKEPTDINALADEYLRLSYHGVLAKDKSFNATIKTDFDSSIGKINIIPQDIGRVLLNLYNNAFYAVNEKLKVKSEKYEPTVSISTKKQSNDITITIEDNGTGIPQNIIDKIFQPFFTTKPTGQGTGLGLSLSYDIIKAHGGEIRVETKEGEARPDDTVGRGTTFIIQLPIA
ncbi:MAG: tetratricopeptide repeat protein [Chitinophagaceae bacterium]